MAIKGFLAEMACHLDSRKVGPHAAIIHRKVRIQCNWREGFSHPLLGSR